MKKENSNANLIDIKVETDVLTQILTKDGLISSEDKMVVVENQKIKDINIPHVTNYSDLSQEDRLFVENIRKNINTDFIVNYATNIQRQLARFMDQVFTIMQGRNSDNIKQVLQILIVNISDFKSHFIIKSTFYSSQKKQLKRLIRRYPDMENKLNEAMHILENQRLHLLKEMTTFEMIEEDILIVYRQLSLYIIAGIEELKELQRINYSKPLTIDTFKRRIEDLLTTKLIMEQLNKQIKGLKETHLDIINRINLCINEIVPSWKKQIILALQNNMVKQQNRDIRDLKLMNDKLMNFVEEILVSNDESKKIIEGLYNQLRKTI